MSVLLDKNSMKFTTSLEAEKIYPLEETGEGTTITASNIHKKDNKLIFDISLDQVNFEELDLIRIFSATDLELNTIESDDFPNDLSAGAKKILFNKEKNVAIYNPKSIIENVQIDLEQLNSSLFSIIIVLEDTPEENSDIYRLDIFEDLISSSKLVNGFSYNEIFNKRFKEPTNLKILEDKTIMSNLLFSTNKDNKFTGLFCLDKRKIINKYAKFPTLIEVENNLLFDSFVFKADVFVYKYKDNSNGYNFADEVFKVKPDLVNNLFVENDFLYRFYEFNFKISGKKSKFQFVVDFFFDDITIRLAKQKLDNIKIFKQNNQRTLTENIFLDFYSQEEFKLKFNFNLDDLDKIPQMDFELITNKFISDIQDKIDDFSKKIVVSTNINRQYSHPKMLSSTFYRSQLEEKFEQKITVDSKKDNNVFIELEKDDGFGNLEFDNFVFNNKKYLEEEDKNFTIVDNLEVINKFKLTSKKEIVLSNEGLQSKINTTDNQQKTQKLLAEKLKKEFVSFKQSKSRDVKFYYLKEVGTNSPVLIFKEVQDDFLDLSNVNGKILVRMDNYEEFHNSYFYVIGTGSE